MNLRLLPNIPSTGNRRDPCQNGGIHIKFNTEESFTCMCPVGYTGNLCENDIDECVDQPCQNGGTCVNTEGSFTCTCPAGYMGDLARMTLMNVWTSHVRMEGPVLTPRKASPARVQLATKGTSVRMTLMNVRISHVSTYILKVSHGYKSNIVQ